MTSQLPKEFRCTAHGAEARNKWRKQMIEGTIAKLVALERKPIFDLASKKLDKKTTDMMRDWVDGKLDEKTTGQMCELVNAQLTLADLIPPVPPEHKEKYDAWRRDGGLEKLAAQHGAIEPLRRLYPDLAEFLHPPKLGRGEKYLKSEIDAIDRAVRDAKLIRQIWEDKYGTSKTRKGELSAEEIVEIRWQHITDADGQPAVTKEKILSREYHPSGDKKKKQQRVARAK